MSTYETARLFAIQSLQNALIAHEANEVLSIGNGLDEYDLLIPRSELQANSLLLLTLEFWSGWSDSAIHGWHFYEPLGKNDWPRLVKTLLEDLNENREVTNKEILSRFNVLSKNSANSFLNRICKIFIQ